MNGAILTAEGLTRRFGALTAVEHVNFAIERNAITSLIGPNGAGKSTIFNLLTGYLPLSAGTIMFAGQRIDGLPTYRIAQAGIARIFQIARPFRGLSVKDNVKVGALYGRNGARDVGATVDRAIDLAGLAEIASRPAYELSVGQLRQVELARAIAARPELLLADEPLAGLNATESDFVLATLRMLAAQGVTILLVEHDMAAVMKISNRVVVLDAGRLIAEGRPEQIARDPKVIAAYLGSDAV
jgi:ABC-type branched-subunit amino acid transport system ATPase component